MFNLQLLCIIYLCLFKLKRLNIALDKELFQSSKYSCLMIQYKIRNFSSYTQNSGHFFGNNFAGFFIFFRTKKQNVRRCVVLSFSKKIIFARLRDLWRGSLIIFNLLSFCLFVSLNVLKVLLSFSKKILGSSHFFHIQ